MHYYNFHIGDYKSHTHHLSLMEDIAYRRLLDYYYLHEHPIKQRDIARQIGMKDQEQEVLTVLDEFFTNTESGYINPRADDEISKYRGLSEAGKRGASKRWEKPSDSHPIATPLPPYSHPNATPIATKNQEPITNKENTATATPEGVSDSVWQDFQKLRKAKKAAITATAMLGIKREADKARVSLQTALETCCERGWVGFKAEWLEQKSFAAPLTVPSRQGVDPALAKAIADQIAGKPPSAEIRAKMAAIRGAT
jgi:uncharacterized protein YdaU (DUF1376 family)